MTKHQIVRCDVNHLAIVLSAPSTTRGVVWSPARRCTYSSQLPAASEVSIATITSTAKNAWLMIPASRATQEQDGQSQEARTQAARFQTLVRLLRDGLSDIKVYRVGDVEADVYVLGKTASGSLAGVTTKIVET